MDYIQLVILTQLLKPLLEAILRETEPQAIAELDEPRFVKDALLTLKDIPASLGDEYGRSYLTAGLVARKFREAAQEIKDNYDAPKYKTWLVALLRGMKTSTQPFGEETYAVMLDFLNLDPSATLQHEVIQTLALRIHNKEQLGINTRVNPDLPLALNSLVTVMHRPDFHKSAKNFAALYHIMQELQQAVDLQEYSDADIARIKMYYGTNFHTTVGIPSREEMELSHQYRDRLVEQMSEWIKDPTLPSDVRYITLQIFDLVGYDYSQTTEDIQTLYQNTTLADRNRQEASLLTDTYLSINFMRDINLHGYYECLTDLLLRRYLKFGDLQAKDLIVLTYVSNPRTREGVSEWLGDWEVDKYIKADPNKMHTIFDRINEQILAGSQEIFEATIKLFGERAYFRHDRYVRDLLISDLDKVSDERKSLLFKEFIKMARNEERWVESDEKSNNEEYNKNRDFGQETVRMIADKMWGFLDSADITEQFWAVYTLNLYNEAGEKFREVVDKLLLASHVIEQAVPGATQSLDKIRDRLSK